MNLERYDVTFSPDFTEFQFYSEGRRGRVRKVVRFDPLPSPNTYNLAFGDEDPVTGMVDYTATTDNGDTRKVLVTVAAIVLVFLRSKPGEAVFAQGSTASRDGLYRINLSRHLNQLPVHLEALGRLGADWEPFAPNKKYDGLLLRWK
ncbi:MAG: hypothetical protein LH606_03180 [Cytophagaceae bacterium]|nr:hypothetical protein [Cytophagaceae bacterium]